MNQTPYKSAGKQQNSSECLQDSVFWIYIGMMILYGIIMLSVMSSSTTELNLLLDSQSFGYGKDTLKMWDNKFIIDIKTAAAGCPDEYEELLNYEWPGTIKGCNCPYTVQKSRQNFIVQGKCNSELLSFNCHDLEPIEPLYLRIWKNRKKLCIQRDAYSFNTSPLDSCQSKDSGFKKCGDGQRAVCVRTTTNCPVSRIQNTAIIVSSATVGEPLEIDDNITYYFERESISDFPIGSFRLQEHSFCAHPDKSNISPDQRGDYILLRERRSACSTTDPRGVELDNIGEEDLFKLNPDLNQITRELPAYPRPSNEYSWKLGYFPYPKWSLECRLSSAYKLSQAKTRLELGTEKYNIPLLQGFTIASIAMVSFVFILIEIRRKMIRKREILRARRLKDEEKHVKAVQQVLVPYSMSWARNTWILILFDRIFQIIHIPIIFISYLQSQGALQWFDDITTNQCGDDWFKTSITKEYRQRIQSLFDYYSTMLGLWWFIFIIDWAVLVFRYVSEIKPAMNKQILIQQDLSKDQDDIQGGTPVEVFDESQYVKQDGGSGNGGESAIFDDEDHLEKKKIDKEPHQEMVIFDDEGKQPAKKDNESSPVQQRGGASPVQQSVFDSNQEVLP